MNILFIICSMIGVININGYDTKESFNILMKDSAVHSIDEFVTTDDYEMVENDNEKLQNIFRLLEELNRLAREEYKKTLHTLYKEENCETSKVNNEIYDEALAQQLNKTKHIISKRNTLTTNDDSDYDYRELLNDYIATDIVNESIKNEGEEHRYEFKEIISTFKNATRQPPKIALIRIWDVGKIWFFVYIVIAVPLWCTKGWCCCCLSSKLFKPKRSIEDAKRYFLQNPPGLLIMPNVGVVCYKPTDNEKESYEKFGHALRTI